MAVASGRRTSCAGLPKGGAVRVDALQGTSTLCAPRYVYRECVHPPNPSACQVNTHTVGDAAAWRISLSTDGASRVILGSEVDFGGCVGARKLK